MNLVIKSGTNDLHGSAFYFNRNEALSANSPVAAPDSPKREIRNNQYGFSLGGPIVRNKTFFFSTLEVQKLTAGNTLPDTRAVAGVGDAGDAVAEPVRRAGESGVDEPADAVARSSTAPAARSR